MTVDLEDPYGPPLPDADRDQEKRLWPHPDAVRHAQSLLAAEPQADLAVVPMFFPGKRKSWWASGQPVRTVHGVVLLSQNTFTPNGFVPDHGWTRDMAARIAALELRAWAAQHPDIRNRDIGDSDIGTVGWATVDHDGAIAVAEDTLTPTQLLSPPSEGD